MAPGPEPVQGFWLEETTLYGMTGNVSSRVGAFIEGSTVGARPASTSAGHREKRSNSAMTCQRRRSYRPIHFREGGCSSPSKGGWAWYRVGHQPRFLACLVNNLRVRSVALEREGRACPAFERHEVFEARPPALCRPRSKSNGVW